MIAFLLLTLLQTETPVEARLVRVHCIWNSDPHSAFTDLVYWKDRFYCVFRVGQKHVSPDGAVQVLTSDDGSTWKPAARLTSPVSDLRDPKLVVAPTGELQLFAAGAMHDKTLATHRNYRWTSNDGITWSQAAEIGEADSWLWRVTAYEKSLFGCGYGTSKERFVRLYQQNGAADWKPVTPPLLKERGYPNETAMVMENGHAWCLLRRDGKSPDNTGFLGTAKAPFTDWTWRDVGVPLGGPSLLRLPNGQFLATVRLYTPKVRTAVCLLDPQKPALKELLTLPSGGDCSYAGMVWHRQKLWISYYSSHEGKSAVYFSEVEVKQE